MNFPVKPKFMMKSKIQSILLALFCSTTAMAQFHTLSLPKGSNYVYEKQVLGVTEITVEYHSPRVRERDVWNDAHIVPQNGDPIPWRVGANMNTTISFSTDVEVEGQPLPAGKYGLHMIPKGGEFEVLFAHNNNLWGSYYLDQEKDVALRVSVTSEPCPFSEKLDFEFIHESGSSMIMGIEWAEKRIPFTVNVDLNETVIASLRDELRGINTYRWEAWNDAANWCYDNDVNLEEALEWAQRSIDGGYGGFAYNRNAMNTLTKAKLQKKLGLVDAHAETLEEMLELNFTAGQSNRLISYFLNEGNKDMALSMAKKAQERYEEIWFVNLNLGIAYYANGDRKRAEKYVETATDMVPDSYAESVKGLLVKVQDGTLEI